MALTIYPLDNYDSFCTVADADTLLTANVPTSQRTSWDALIEADKEIYLRQATTIIRTKVSELPTTLEDDLKLACAYLANYSVGIDMTNSDNKGNLKRINIANETIEKEYFTQTKDSNDLPDIVVSLLAQYGVKTTGTFSFQRS